VNDLLPGLAPVGLLVPGALVLAGVATGPVYLIGSHGWPNPGSDLLALVAFLICAGPASVLLYVRGSGLYLVGDELEHRRRRKPTITVCSVGDIDHLLAKKTKLYVIGHQGQELYQLDNNWKLYRIAPFADLLRVHVVRDY
jgi:hypothetical protein